MYNNFEPSYTGGACVVAMFDDEHMWYKQACNDDYYALCQKLVRE